MARQNIGNQVTGSSSVQFPPANNKAACRYQNATGYAITIDKLYATWGIPNNTVHIKAVIYSDNAGSPNALLATSDERTGVTGGWDVFTFSSPLVVEAGSYIWIGVIADATATGSNNRTAAAGTIKYNADTYSDGPSATFGTPTNASFEYPIFAEGDDGTLRFGRASVDSGSGNYQPDREHGEKVVLGGASSVSVVSISTYVKTTSATVKCKAAIFNDSGDAPATKVAQTVEVTGATANSWLTLSFATPVTLAPGTYWLCFIASENLVTPTIPASGRLKVDGTDTEASAFSSPSTLSLNAAVGQGIDIYATYTAGESFTSISGEAPVSLTAGAALKLGTSLAGDATANLTATASLQTGTHMAATAILEATPRGRLAGAAATPGAGNFFLLF